MKDKENSFEFQAIGKTRGLLLGVATILIVLFHSQILYLENLVHFNFIKQFFLFIKQYASVGVDMFLFLSAFGLYYSFSKNNNIKLFYKKRFLRIVPEFFIVSTIFALLTQKNCLTNYLQDITFLSQFLRNECNYWFFSLLITMYLFYPLFHKLTDKYDAFFIIPFVILIILSNFLLLNFNPVIYQRIEIMTTRIPTFIMGIYFGKMAKNNYKISKKYLFVVIALFLLIVSLLYNNVYNDFIMVRLSFCPLAISLIIMLTYLFLQFKKDNIVKRFIIWVGTYSMEIYLFYELLLKQLGGIFKFSDKYNVSYCMCIFIITMYLSVQLKKFNDEITKKVILGEEKAN